MPFFIKCHLKQNELKQNIQNIIFETLSHQKSFEFLRQIALEGYQTQWNFTPLDLRIVTFLTIFIKKSINWKKEWITKLSLTLEPLNTWFFLVHISLATMGGAQIKTS